ncbi:uncharacterized protein LOC115875492 [Sitophilus oryzae]|uniref:Uncharacterized protein LOC115875492 n=1 Tax=Sitophilus oryzae TaxID=7048 RepID=A0A6J2X7H8_SITOR|nr:uncharacterized protein LOC115875492 [Sitophilus oryzae]
MDSEMAGPSGIRAMTRREIFDLMSAQNRLDINEKLEFVENHFATLEPYSDEQIKEIKHKFSYVKSEIKRHWIAAKQRPDLLGKNNQTWLKGVFELPKVQTNPGRPKKLFEEASGRTKRRKTEELRLSDR